MLMDAVHNHHFSGSGTRIHPGADDAVPHVHGRFNSAQGMAIIDIVRIISNGPINPLASNATSQRGSNPPAAPIVLESILFILIPGQLKDRPPTLLVPKVLNQAATPYTIPYGETLTMGHKKPTNFRAKSPLPGGPKNASDKALTKAWRNIDHQL
jgi:hypothetical protein